MEPTHTKHVARSPSTTQALEQKVEGAEDVLRERVEQARDMALDLRERAEMLLHERPYLLPVATGALGFGLGLLVGSKLTRVLLFTAAGAMLSDKVRGQVARIGRDFIRDIGVGMEDEAHHDEEIESAV